MEIEANYEFFKEAMKAELEIFYAAFANKNCLFPSPDKLENSEDDKEVTPKDIDRAMKIGAMMDGMERHTLRKAITAGNDPQEGGGGE